MTLMIMWNRIIRGLEPSTIHGLSLIVPCLRVEFEWSAYVRGFLHYNSSYVRREVAFIRVAEPCNYTSHAGAIVPTSTLNWPPRARVRPMPWQRHRHCFQRWSYQSIVTRYSYLKLRCLYAKTRFFSPAHE